MSSKQADTTTQSPEQVAAKYASLFHGISARYVGGGRIAVANHNTPTPCVRYITVPQARRAIVARSH